MKKKTTITRFAAAALLSMAALAAAPAALAQTADKPYTYVEQMPEFEGGAKAMMQFLGANIRYPQEARDAGTEGLVVVSFVVDADGSLKDVAPVKGLSPAIDAEALRVINLMNRKWQPGKQNGKVVAVRYTLPVRFALSEADKAAAADKANRMPQFKGGQEALFNTISKHLQLPAEAKKENLNARVVVKFYIEKDGSVSNIRLADTKLKKKVGAGADMDYMDASTFRLQNKAILAQLAEAAIAAVKATSGNWEPATKNGQPTGADMALPIQFLSSEKAN